MAVLLLLFMSSVLVINASQQTDNRWTPMPPANNDQYTPVSSNTIVKKHGYVASYKPSKETARQLNTGSAQQNRLIVRREDVNTFSSIFGNIGEGLLWLNLFLGNKMNHENVTEQIDALTENMQVTKDTLLEKLEENTESLHTVEEILNKTYSDAVEDLF